MAQRTLSRALSGLVVALLFVCGLTLPQHAFAATTLDQCKTDPKLADCVSFDPARNPILQAAGATYSNVYGTTPKDSGVNGTCLIYNVPGTIASGCVRDGIFVIGENSAVANPATGDQTTGAAEKTAQGDTYTPTTGALPNAPGCNAFIGFDLGACLVGLLAKIVSGVSLIVLLVSSAILGLASYALNWSAYITVFQFGNLVGNSEGLLKAWGVMRDVGNIVLLFGFIFLGISTILNLSHSEYTAKRALPALLIFALLMNFSLLAAEAIIDTSNALATSIYTQASGGLCEQGTSFLDCSIQQGISGKVMAATGVASIFKFAPQFTTGNDTTNAIILIGLTLFTIITACVLFAAAIMLIIRAVVLALLMVTSPIGFAGMAIPPLHEMASGWWKQLLSQAFFAPIYFLLVLVSLKVMEGISAALGTTGQTTPQSLAQIFMTSATEGGSSNITIGITFALIIGFMVASLIFAKNSSAIGTGYAIKSAGALSFGTLSWAGRRTVGRGAYTAANALRGTSFARTGVGKMFVGTLDAGGKASYDIRNSGAAKGIAASQHIDLGKAQTGGYAGVVHAEEEKRTKYAKTLRNTEEEKAAQKALATSSTNSNKAIETATVAHRKELAELESELKAEEIKNETTLAPEREKINELRNKLRAAEAAGNEAQIKDTQLALNNQLRYLDEMKEEAEKRLKPFKDEIANAKNVNREYIAAHQDNIKFNENKTKTIKDAPQRDFAENLHKNTPWDVAGGVGADANHHAAEAILREVNKNEQQKLADSYNAAATALKAAQSGGGDHGGGGHGGH